MGEDITTHNNQDNGADGNASSTGKEDAGIKEKLAACEAKRDEYLAGWQRAKADFLNYKKEELARMQDMARYANLEFVSELIVVIDNFDLGLAALEKAGPVEKGIYLIKGQIEDILRRNGVTKLEASTGKRFDPSIHEAVGEVASDKEAGTIVEEVAPGYRFHDRLIRPARVRVAKAKAA